MHRDKPYGFLAIMVKVFASGVGHLSALQGQEDDRHAHATLK